MARMSLSSIMLHHPYRPDGWYAVLHTSVPWITFHRDIHRGYPQVNLEAQLSTDIHRWMMWISTAGYISPRESQGGKPFKGLCTFYFKTTKCISQQLEIDSDGLAYIKCRVGLLVDC